MKESELSFLLESIQSLAFVNPFANERDEIEGAILSQIGWTEKSSRYELKVHEGVQSSSSLG